MAIEHLNNAYSSGSTTIAGAIPFLCHPDEVKYRQFGARVTDTLEEGQLVHAGTPMEIDFKTHEAKFMKVWEVIKVEANTDDSTKSDITIAKNWLSPAIVATDVVMVVPSTIGGTGKAVAVGTLTKNSDGDLVFTVATSKIDTVTAGSLLSIASEAGTGKALLVKANSILTRDLYAGNKHNLVDIPRGELYCYVNTINPIPDAVIAAARENGLIIAPEYFGEVSLT